MIMEEINSGSVVVAVSILLVIGGLGITAIIRYPVDQALKVWTALGGILGVVIGAFVTYFFTRQPILQAQKRADVAEQKISVLETRSKELEKQATAVASRVYSAGKTPGIYASAYLKDPVIEKFVERYALGSSSIHQQDFDQEQKNYQDPVQEEKKNHKQISPKQPFQILPEPRQ
jgi:hypothetical protein